MDGLCRCEKLRLPLRGALSVLLKLVSLRLQRSVLPGVCVSFCVLPSLHFQRTALLSAALDKRARNPSSSLLCVSPFNSRWRRRRSSQESFPFMVFKTKTRQQTRPVSSRCMRSSLPERKVAFHRVPRPLRQILTRNFFFACAERQPPPPTGLGICFLFMDCESLDLQLTQPQLLPLKKTKLARRLSACAFLPQ